MTRYRVEAPYVTLQTDTSQGQRLIGLNKDAIVPADVPADQIQRHLDKGLIAAIEEMAVPTPEPQPETPVVVPEQTPAIPAKTATKAEWVTYAVTQGLSKEQAEAATRDQLAAKYSA